MNKRSVLISFIFGFLFVVFLVLIGGSVIFGKNYRHIKKINSVTPSPIPLKTYEGAKFSIKYPENYQLNENKIVGTEDITDTQENTIQLISPNLPDSNGNMSMIIAYEPVNKYEEKIKGGSTCAELDGKELEPIIIGEYTFTTSGLINCGPNEVAFFYFTDNNYVYEVKVETTADYEKNALPEVLKILSSITFN